MKRKILGIMGIALWVLPQAALGTTWEERSTQHVDLAGVTTLRVENSRGLIDIRGRAGRTLDLNALKVSKAPHEAQAKANAEDISVETERQGDVFAVRVRYPRRHAIRIGIMDILRGHEPPWAEVRLTLEVPRDLDLLLRAATADVATAAITGNQDIEASSGDVMVMEAGGGLTVATSSGDIEAKDVMGGELRAVSGDVKVKGVRRALEARAVSGDLSVDGASDSLMLRTVSGDLRVAKAPRGISASTTSGDLTVRSASGRVKLSTSNGEIEAWLDAPLGPTEISTISGDIVARMADDVACQLEMRTSGGRLDLTAPIQLKNVSRRQVTGVIRQGTIPVVLTSSAGDIELHSGGN